ncbi:hypothetical protein J2853_009642 [Streptosporangium lutulentum]|uniref:Uncharacterized protein n=1 Tax=Streptosporangium lutulentum TaxID=1461250 RepID=A0ABT9QUA7_9ACTN|nr:hypothetical protein [Streptosporangium lutulentum]
MAASSRLKPKSITGFGRPVVEDDAEAPPVPEPPANAEPPSEPEAPVQEPTAAEAPPVPEPPANAEPPSEPEAPVQEPTAAEAPPVPEPPANAEPPSEPEAPVQEPTAAEAPPVPEPPANAEPPSEPEAPVQEPTAAEAPPVPEPPANAEPPSEPEAPVQEPTAAEAPPVPEPPANAEPPSEPEAESHSRQVARQSNSSRALIALPRVSHPRGAKLGPAGKAFTAAYLLAYDGDERWENFSIRLPDDLKKRATAAMVRYRKVLKRRSIGENHLYAAALAVVTPADLDTCIQWAKSRRTISDEEAPSRSTTIPGPLKDMMADLEGDLRVHARHGLFGHLLTEIVSRFLDQLDAELPPEKLQNEA